MKKWMVTVSLACAVVFNFAAYAKSQPAKLKFSVVVPHGQEGAIVLQDLDSTLANLSALGCTYRIVSEDYLVDRNVIHIELSAGDQYTEDREGSLVHAMVTARLKSELEYISAAPFGFCRSVGDCSNYSLTVADR
jgi:hypothetical protein